MPRKARMGAPVKPIDERKVALKTYMLPREKLVLEVFAAQTGKTPSQLAAYLISGGLVRLKDFIATEEYQRTGVLRL